jgi:hypothetical protein
MGWGDPDLFEVSSNHRHPSDDSTRDPRIKPGGGGVDNVGLTQLYQLFTTQAGRAGAETSDQVPTEEQAVRPKDAPNLGYDRSPVT